MLLTSIRRAPFIDLPEGNCDFLKEITLFRYSPFIKIIIFSDYRLVVILDFYVTIPTHSCTGRN